MRIQPVPSVAASPGGASANSVITLKALPSGQKVRVSALLAGVQANVDREILELGADRQTVREFRERARAERDAKRIIYKARREAAAAEKIVREKQRELAALEEAAEDQVHTSFTPSELRQALQSARRLNVRA